MAQERVSRRRAKRDHRSFRKPWGVGWALWWWGVGLGAPGEGPSVLPQPLSRLGEPSVFEMGGALSTVGGEGLMGRNEGRSASPTANC